MCGKDVVQNDVKRGEGDFAKVRRVNDHHGNADGQGRYHGPDDEGAPQSLPHQHIVADGQSDQSGERPSKQCRNGDQKDGQTVPLVPPGRQCSTTQVHGEGARQKGCTRNEHAGGE